jgi:hypothetical protein
MAKIIVIVIEDYFDDLFLFIWLFVNYKTKFKAAGFLNLEVT